MADVITSQIYDGQRNVNLKITNVSDGTGQTLVKILDVSLLVPNPGLHLKVRHIKAAVRTMSIRLMWEATVPIDFAYLTEGGNELDFSSEYAGGYPNNGGAGATGNILLSTVGPVPTSGYTIDLQMIKGV